MLKNKSCDVVSTQSWENPKLVKHYGSTTGGFLTIGKKCDEMHWQQSCTGCGHHDSFWKTVVTSPQWKAWEKEHARRWREHVKNKSETFEGCFDIAECRELGCIGKEHFQEFISFLLSQRDKEIVALLKEVEIQLEETNIAEAFDTITEAIKKIQA